MPIDLPELDDRRFPDLVQEGVALIPMYSRRWTNHNAADPGITLLELFAYLTDVLLYRLNRISDGNRLKFLKLLTGEPTRPELNGEALESALREATLAVGRLSRAVTCDDFERLARMATDGESSEKQVQRSLCLPRRDLDASAAEERRRDRPGHTSVIFIPGDPWADEQTVQTMRDRLRSYFEPRRLLTSRVHVIGPRYLDVGVSIRVAGLPGSSRSAVTSAASRELTRFFHPLAGGPEGLGWPFGRSVFTSDIYRLIENIDGVDFIKAVEFQVGDSGRLRRNEFDEVIEIQLWPEELVRLRIAEVTFESSAGTGSGSW